MNSRTALLGLLVLLSGCAATGASRAPLKLTLLHTNDHHGRFWTNAEGEGGLAARKTLIDAVRAEVQAAGGHVLLLDSGDVNTGVPESDLQDAAPDFKGMNLLGYQAMAVGNHEFDNSAEVLGQQRTWANFPFLSANVYVKGQRMFQPWLELQRGGYRIAILGLTTEDSRKQALAANVEGLEFRPAIQEAARLVPSLREHADLVIALTHLGHYPGGQRGVNAPGDVELARAVPGLDVIVGGHSQNPVCMTTENVRDENYAPGAPCAPDRQNGAWIVQAHEWGRYLGRADLEISGSGQVSLVRYQLIPVNLKRRTDSGKLEPVGERVPEDRAVREFLRPFQEAGQEKLSAQVGTAAGRFDGDRSRIRRQPTDLGQLVTRAMRERTGADLAIVNSGGLRDSLPAGALTYRDVLKVLPFGDSIVVVRLGGEELRRYLQGVARITPGSGGYPQIAGASLRVEAGVLREATVAGAPLDDQRQYLLALNTFTATGGDGYPRLSRHPGFQDTGVSDAEVLRAYIAAHSPLAPADYQP